MLPNDTRRKIENIVAGTVIEGETDYCTTIRNSFCRRFATSTTVKEDFEGKSIIKKEQALLIADFCNERNLWVTDVPSEQRYLTRGGEAKVYLHSDNLHVIKLNDAVYYATWLEFLNSLLLHNILFENTAYHLLGFVMLDNELYAVLKQPFIISDAPVDLEDVKKYYILHSAMRLILQPEILKAAWDIVNF
jgi:hypothetical protein